MRHAAVWMGLVKFAAADVIAGGVECGAREEERDEEREAVGREGFNEGRWCLSRLNRFSMGGSLRQAGAFEGVNGVEMDTETR